MSQTDFPQTKTVDSGEQCSRMERSNTRSRMVNDSGSLKYPKTVIVMVGLPARGKTFMAKKLSRYFNWIGLRTEVFNVGSYRRVLFPEFADSNFFDSGNEVGQRIRRKCAEVAMSELCDWLTKTGNVAIFDATNTTRDRRTKIVKVFKEEHNFEVMFVESLCDDDSVIDKNVQDVKVNSPDYLNIEPDEAVTDFNRRIEAYKKQYERLDEGNDNQWSYIKIMNVGRSYIVNRISGHIQSRVVYFLMNIHVLHRSIYLTRSSETLGELNYKLGDDDQLSERGNEYSAKLSEYIKKQNIPDLVIWTSEMASARKTVEGLDICTERWRALNELDAGLFQGLSYREMATKFSQQLSERDTDKFGYRYPMGESYEDLVQRLEPVIIELERAENILVVTHQAVARCILAYYINANSNELPYIRIPLHSLLKLTPTAYGCEVEEIELGVKAVDTHRDKPKNCSANRTLDEALETTPGYIPDKQEALRARRVRRSTEPSLPTCFSVVSMDKAAIDNNGLV